MTAKRFKFAAAVTLIEVMVAMVVLAIAATGALGYQYHAAAQVRIARAETTATGIAQLL
ncbi:MAG: type IV pilus modification PilV family protein, partial [Planctomycetota bacterium]